MQIENKSKSKSITLALATVIMCFYFMIVTYVLFVVTKIHLLHNFFVGITFEFIGFILLAAVILGNVLSKSISTGYFVSLIFVTILYTVFLNVLNMAAILVMPGTLFVLLHMILLFVYCVVSVPMYIMGKIK